MIIYLFSFSLSFFMIKTNENASENLIRIDYNLERDKHHKFKFVSYFFIWKGEFRKFCLKDISG